MSSLNLRKSIVNEFWKSRSPRMGMILQWMEGMEDWGMDEDQGFSEALLLLVPQMERASREAMIQNAEPLTQVMAYMSSSRALRLMEWFDEHFPQGLSVELVESAQQRQEDPTAHLMLDRLRALQSLSLLGQVFSPARTRFITSLLREASDGLDEGQSRR